MESLISDYPFRERLRAQLMLALYRSGHQADALGAYRAARSQFMDELGIEPGRSLGKRGAAILQQDPELAPAPPADRPAAAVVETPAPRAVHSCRRTERNRATAGSSRGRGAARQEAETGS